MELTECEQKIKRGSLFLHLCTFVSFHQQLFISPDLMDIRFFFNECRMKFIRYLRLLENDLNFLVL